MNRLGRAFAVLLLSAAAADAQTRAVAPVSVSAVPAVPAVSVFGVPSAAPLSVPSLAAPALSATALAAPVLAPSAPLVPGAAVPAAVAPSAAPSAAAAPAAVPAAAPALAALNAAADGTPSRRSAPASPARAEDTARFQFGDALFDGKGDLTTRSGSVFSPSLKPVPSVPGGVAFVRVKPAPRAAVRTVPDTQGLYGAALLQRVGEIAAKGQIEHTYHDSSRYLFSVADNHTLNGVHGVADAYSGIFVPGTSADGHDYREEGDQDHDGYSRNQAMNVEHVFPQSLFKQDLPMRSDLHHLMATFEHPNGMRGNLPFGVVTGPVDYHNDAGAKRGSLHFEPPDFTKGRVARAMLYFYSRYRNEAFFQDPRAIAFWNGQVDTLLDWNRRFGPDAEETRRNDHVQAFQGNRNPFVDDPALAERIGAEAFRIPVARSPAPKRPVESQEKRSDKPRKGKKRQGFVRPRSSRSVRGFRRG